MNRPLSNYPDDIHQYDNDPRSPFYDDSEERAREDEIERVASDLREVASSYSSNNFCKAEYELDAWDILNHISENHDINDYINEAAEVLAAWRIEQ